MRLTSDTTTLRRMRADDLMAFQAYRRDPAIARFQNWEHMDDTRAAHFLHHSATVEPLLRPGHWTQIAVADTETDALIGDIGLRIAKDEAEGETGITLAAAHHGRGHAQRAMHLAIGLMFRTTRIARIRAWADIRNTKSVTMLHRVGFAFLGHEVTDGIKEAAFELRRDDHEPYAGCAHN
ncbi:GNAT family N-acetyltransferase [uncultured Tateyamaria sp.]|uniref:GNAT family N-acetyltransferase n=1 Tax=Tateyamaria sp. 1078 TaxID=3417464 RepID=UPI00263403FF|nr:GNAT family N-acetyltransferase [uncultured Tateyamaria sp.]